MESGTSVVKCQNSSLFEELNGLVYEYLELNGMGSTTLAFLADCEAKALPCPTVSEGSGPGVKSNFSKTDAEGLINCFNEGDFAGFSAIWQNFLEHIHLTGETLKKLEVYLRVHFAIWPKVYGESEAVQMEAMRRLKEYFEERSSSLSSDASILPLLALPFVKDPVTHPTFHALFETAWSERVKLQLETTLAMYFRLVQENIGDHSRLASIVMQQKSGEKDGGKTGANDLLVKYHHNRFLQLMGTYRKVRRLLRGTRESYGKLLKVSNELITELETSASGQPVGVESTIQKCFEIFPELFTPDVITNATPDKEYFKKLAGAAIFDNVLDSDVSLFFIGISDLSPESIDYGKLKNRLVDEGTQSEKLCLLQAVRWLLTRSTPRCREYAMESFIRSDLLGLSSNMEDFRIKLFSCMLSPAPTYFKECFVRLLNAVSSMKSGRAYLARTSFCLEMLVKALGTLKTQTESYISQMVIATLQKLSLRKKVRLTMIQLNVIQCLVIYLKSELAKKGFAGNSATVVESPVDPTYNPYLMEYGWALLMNLCLHDESRGPALSIATDILTSIVQMLVSNPSNEVAPYVVSTLYSLLRNPDIYAMAKRMKLQDTLKDLASQHPAETRVPLSQLVEILNVNTFDRLTASGEVDYDDDDETDPDEFEPELEVPEGWVTSLEISERTGDDLLIRHYLLENPTEVVLPNAPSTKTHNEGVIMRPTTPSKSSQLTTRFMASDNEIKSSTARRIEGSKCSEQRSSVFLVDGVESTSTKRTSQHSSNPLKLKTQVPKIRTIGLLHQTRPCSILENAFTLNKFPAKLSKTGGSSLNPFLNGNTKAPNNNNNLAESPKRRTKFKGSRPGMDQFESNENKKSLDGSSLVNLINGKYNEFDNGMYTDDIFASVSQTVEKKKSQDESSSKGSSNQKKTAASGKITAG